MFNTLNNVILGGLQKTTLIDFPGKIACTVFLSGCNFRCPFCYSAELVLPEKIKNHPQISKKYFFDFLKGRKGLLEGVCITGGEPTLNKDLPDFIKKIKKLSRPNLTHPNFKKTWVGEKETCTGEGFLVKLDTNGSNPEMLKELIDKKLVDYVAMDIKAPKEKYAEATGIKVDLKKIQKSIDILKEGKVDYEFRSTIVPSLHTREDVIAMAKWIRGAKKYYLQNFRPEKTVDPSFEKIKPYPQEHLLEIQKTISPFFEICQVR